MVVHAWLVPLVRHPERLLNVRVDAAAAACMAALARALDEVARPARPVPNTAAFADHLLYAQLRSLLEARLEAYYAVVASPRHAPVSTGATAPAAVAAAVSSAATGPAAWEDVGAEPPSVDTATAELWAALIVPYRRPIDERATPADATDLRRLLTPSQV